MVVRTTLEGGELSVVKVTDQPENGKVTQNPDGSFTYTPNTDFVGEDCYNYQITDGVSTDIARVCITIAGPGDRTPTEALDFTFDVVPEAGAPECPLAAEMAAMGEAAPLDLRVNLLKGTREEAVAALLSEGIAAEVTGLSPWGLRVEGRRLVTSGPAFQTGLVEIQDEGSQLVALMVGALPGMRVADWCAGGGA